MCFFIDKNKTQLYNDFINTNLSKGRNISFKTYYEVPINAEKIELEYETNIWTNKKIIIKLK